MSTAAAPVPRPPKGYAFRGPYLVPVPRRPAVAEIQAAAARHYGYRIEDMHAARRSPRVVRARQVAMHLAVELTPLSASVLGRLFERDRTTVLYGAARIAQRRRTDAVLDRTVRSLTAQLGAGR